MQEAENDKDSCSVNTNLKETREQGELGEHEGEKSQGPFGGTSEIECNGLELLPANLRIRELSTAYQGFEEQIKGDIQTVCRSTKAT